MLLDGKWDRGREKKRKREKLIATFCSAINDDEEGRETFRWLREDVLRCPLFFLLVTPHPPLSLSVCFAYSQFLGSPSNSWSHSTIITTTARVTTTTMAIDPQNGIKGKNTRGIQKALKIPLYFTVDSIRSLARVRVINRRIPSRHFVFFFSFSAFLISAAVSYEASLSKLKFLVFE